MCSVVTIPQLEGNSGQLIAVGNDILILEPDHFQLYSFIQFLLHLPVSFLALIDAMLKVTIIIHQLSIDFQYFFEKIFIFFH